MSLSTRSGNPSQEPLLHQMLMGAITTIWRDAFAFWRIWMNWKAELLWNTVQLNYSSPNLICEVKRRNLLEVLPVLRIDYSVLIDIILQDVSCEGNRACTWILIWLKVDNRRSWFLVIKFCQCSGCLFSQFYESLEYADSLCFVRD